MALATVRREFFDKVTGESGGTETEFFNANNPVAHALRRCTSLRQVKALLGPQDTENWTVKIIDATTHLGRLPRDYPVSIMRTPCGLGPMSDEEFQVHTSRCRTCAISIATEG